MMYKFSPTYSNVEGVVKKITPQGNYSTHIPPYTFEIDESKNMFICGKSYDVDKEIAIELALSGYLEFLDQSPLEEDL